MVDTCFITKQYHLFPTIYTFLQLASIEKHLIRMARAYEERQHTEDRDSSCTSVATQTDKGVYKLYVVFIVPKFINASSGRLK